MTDNCNTPQDLPDTQPVTPFAKQIKPVITGSFEIGEDGRVSFYATDGKIEISEDARFGWRVGLGMHMTDKLKSLWYAYSLGVRKNGGAK